MVSPNGGCCFVGDVYCALYYMIVKEFLSLPTQRRMPTWTRHFAQGIPTSAGVAVHFHRHAA